MSDRNRCAWATQVPDLVADAPRTGPVRGLVVHTSGRGVVTKAARAGVPAIEMALAYYQRAAFSAHYVIDYDGALYQLTADDRRVQHVGLTAADREAYLSGAWQQRISRATSKLWRDRWPYVLSPAHLYPSRAPNSDFVGVELLPLAKADGGLWYTSEQHRTAGRLYADLAARHRWPECLIDGWRLLVGGWYAWTARSPVRLLCHEDLSPLTRWDRGGGWDPGALRAAPRLDWGWVLGAAGAGAELVS